MATRETGARRTDAAGLTLEELVDELATLAAHLNAGTCRWLELVGEIDRRGGWAESGLDSCAEWLAWRCSLMPRTAREHVRVARRLPELPEIRAAFACGRLSYAKVRALTRVATPENESDLLRLSRAFTAAQLERTVRAYRRVTTAEAREQLEDAFLSVYWDDDDGSLVVRGRLAPEDGALFLRSLEAMHDTLRERARGSAEPRPTRQASNAEALAALADAALAHDGESRNGGERYQIVLHADEAALSRDGEGGCELEDGSPLAPETARRLACDASVVRHGRRTRTIPPALRRALRRRNRGCRFPAAGSAASSTPTTSTTGREAARRASTTSSSSAATTTASSTRAATASAPTAASTTRGGSRSPTSRGSPAGSRTSCSGATAASRSTQAPATRAPASASTSISPSKRSSRSGTEPLRVPWPLEMAGSRRAKKGESFSAEERAAMKERARELKGGAKGKAHGESEVLAKIAELPDADRAIAERLHAIVTATAPELVPRTWYGMPAYAQDGKVLCFFQGAGKFKTRYATLGFSDRANLDDGAMWPTTFALKELTGAVEARIAELVKQAVS